MTKLSRLCKKLCRELARSERRAVVHGRREATRLGASSPADALIAIAEHAEGQRPRFAHLLARRDLQLGSAGNALGSIGAIVRGLLVRMFDHEQRYRGTLLGLRHGLDIVRLLREVAAREGDLSLVRFCDEMLVERRCLIERAEQGLAWFAEQPERALASGLRFPFGSARSLPAIAADGGSAFDRREALQ